MTLCECGCGEETLFNKKKKSYNKFIFGHQNRGKNNPMFGNHHSEESNHKNSEAHKGKKASEETRKKLSELNSGEKNNNYGKPLSEKQKEAISKAQKGKKHTEEHRRKNSEANTGEKNHFYGKKHSEESKQKMSKALTGRKLTKEHKQKVSKFHSGRIQTKEHRRKNSEAQKGEKNHMWNGGSSYLPYCVKFSHEFKERVREFFDRKCFNCGEKENGRKLCVHHVNYDKMVCCNDVTPLFVPLCATCHTTTNGNRDYWEYVFTQELMEQYDGECYLPREIIH